MTSLRSGQDSQSDQEPERIYYRKISKDANPGPVLDVVIETYDGVQEATVEAVVDTGTALALALPSRFFDDYGFVGTKDITTITIPGTPILKQKIDVHRTRSPELADVKILGRTIINQLVLLLHGPGNFFQIKDQSSISGKKSSGL